MFSTNFDVYSLQTDLYSLGEDFYDILTMPVVESQVEPSTLGDYLVFGAVLSGDDAEQHRAWPCLVNEEPLQYNIRSYRGGKGQHGVPKAREKGKERFPQRCF